MKQLRLIILMLVACMAQASYAQQQELNWDERRYVDNGLIHILLFSSDLSSGNLEKQFDDIPQKLEVAERKAGSPYGDPSRNAKQAYQYIKDRLYGARNAVYNVNKRLAKGKSIAYEDALWAALISQKDGVAAAKFFDLAANSTSDDSTQIVLRLSAIGCKYRMDKDKASAAAAINFTIPDNCKNVVIQLLHKYDMMDVPAEAILQMRKADSRNITRAIRSNNLKELEKYEQYDIPEVDSILALNGKKKELYWKCMTKHNMLWPMKYLYERDLDITALPDNAFKHLFLLQKENGEGFEKYNMLNDMYSRSGRILDWRDNYGDEKKLLGYLNTLNERSRVAALSMAVIAQAFGQYRNTDDFRYEGKVYSHDFIIDLCENTAKLLGSNDSEKAKMVGYMNNTFGKYFSINSDGVVKLKISRKLQFVEMYEKLAGWIQNSSVYTPVNAQIPESDILMWLVQNLDKKLLGRLVWNGCIYVIVQVDADGSTSINDVQDKNHRSVFGESVFAGAKMPTKGKPAMHGGRPVSATLLLRIARESGEGKCEIEDYNYCGK